MFWWIGNVHSQKRIIDQGYSDILITTDASPKGGVLFVINVVQDEDGVLIKYRIISIFLALKSFCMDFSDIHVKIMTDNACAKAYYINNVGGIKPEKMNILSRKIWFWCMNRNNRILLIMFLLM